MISISSVELYCYEDISLIENYNEAINSDKQYVCHHKNEIILNKSRIELIKMGLYYNRPANELIFLTRSEHSHIHTNGNNNPMYGKNDVNNPNYGSHRTQEQKNNISKSLLGRKLSEEHKNKISIKTKGENNPMYSKKHSEKSKQLMSIHKKGKYIGTKNPMYGKHTIFINNGVINKRIEKELLDEYICVGWHRGMIKKKKII